MSSKPGYFVAIVLAWALAFAVGWPVGRFLWQTVPASPEPMCAAASRRMQRIELVFGLSRRGRPDLGEAEWTEFLAAEVTPRFPDGLTVLAGHGQWRNQAGVIVREPSRLLLVWAPPAPDLDARIDRIRDAWKRAHDQESVLKALSTDCVSF